MTFSNWVLAMTPLLIIVSPLLFGLYLSWLQNRPGGAGENQVRRISELHNELGQKPGLDPAKLSWIQAVHEVNWLEGCVRTRRTIQRLNQRLE